MIVRELIEYLEVYDANAEIRVAFQPNWPLRAKVRNVISSEEIAQLDSDADEDPASTSEDIEDAQQEAFVWIAIDQVASYYEDPYAPKLAWQAA